RRGRPHGGARSRRTRELEHHRPHLEHRRAPPPPHRRPADRPPGRDLVAHGQRGGRVVRGREHGEHCGRRPRRPRARMALGARAPRAARAHGRAGGLCRRLARRPAMTVLAGSPLWYLSRGSGVVSLLLLTTAVLLGVASVRRRSARRLPRFVLAGLHRNVTLLAVVFILVHVLTAVADGYAPIRLVDAFVPFVSRYRPL